MRPSQPIATPTHAQLAEWVRDARRRTLALIEDLSDQQLFGPRLTITNPLLWEIGHVAWFQEFWALRRDPEVPSLRPNADVLYNSADVRHDTRWDLHLPNRAETLAYMADVEKAVLDKLHQGSSNDDLAYFVRLGVFHEDMHDEAFTYTRQTLNYPAPAPAFAPAAPPAAPPITGDTHVPGGEYQLGAVPGAGFVFDNEKWAHSVNVKPLAIARTAVTQSEFLAFVEDGGYWRAELWSPVGWQWRERQEAEHPVYWQRDDHAQWSRRHFDQWLPLEPDLPVHHINWHEADAYCRWAGRRLPTEAEWELAASSEKKTTFPWGETPPEPYRANLEGFNQGCVPVSAFSTGDSACGCRQMLGNIWEWTADDFLPYPGFERDPYKEYSEPWFGTHKVLRGGGWATRARLLRNTWRNFYTPTRRDIFAGFRTCALQP